LPWLKRIYGAAQALRPEHFYAGSLLGSMEAIRSGVTTVCEHNFLNPQPECAFETIRALRESGLRAVFARTIMDTGEIVPDCVKEKSEQAFRRIEEIIRANQGSELLSLMTGPNTPPLNTTPELLREICRFADDKSIGISAHVAESKSVVDFTRQNHGQSGVVKFLDDFGIPASTSIFAHCVHVSDDEIAILKERGASVSHNPVSNRMLGNGVAPVVEMLRRGVNVALGTDGAASNHSQDMFETMKTASLLQKVHHQDAGVIEPYAVLRMATAGGAKALGLASVCGDHRSRQARGFDPGSPGHRPQPTGQRSVQPVGPLRQSERRRYGDRRRTGLDEKSRASIVRRAAGPGGRQESERRPDSATGRAQLLTQGVCGDRGF